MALEVLAQLVAELQVVLVVLAQTIVEHLEPVTGHLDYLLAAVAGDMSHTGAKEIPLGREARVVAEQVAQPMEPREQQLKGWLERPTLVQAVVVARLTTADQLAPVLGDRVQVDQALSLFVMPAHLHKQLAALYLR